MTCNRPIAYTIALLSILGTLSLTLAQREWGPYGSWWFVAGTTVATGLYLRHAARGRKPVLNPLIGTLVSFLIIGWTLVQVVNQGIVLASIGQVAIFLQWVKLLQRQKNRDVLQLVLLSYAQLMVAAVLTEAIWFGVVFFVYLALTMWILLVFHFKQETEGDFAKTAGAREALRETRATAGVRHLIRGRLLALLLIITTITTTLTIVVFILFPRLPAYVLLPFAPPGTGNTSGLSDTIRIGGAGTINRDTDTALYAAFPEPYTPRHPDEDLLYRAIVLTTYNRDTNTWEKPNLDDENRWPVLVRGAAWRSEGVLEREARRSELDDAPATAATWRSFLPPPRARETGTLTCRLHDAQRHRLRYLPMPGIPVEIEVHKPTPSVMNPRTYRHVFPQSWMTVWNKDEPPPIDPVEYTVTTYRNPRGMPALAQAAVVNAPPDAFPETPAMRQLFRDFVATEFAALGRPVPRQWAVADVIALEKVFSREPFTYTLDRKLPPGTMDPIAYFLTERKAGHCEIYATAMALILQAHDIATRMVTGFAQGDNWAEQDDPDFPWVNIVTNAHAHAWLEVNVQGWGWVPFNPSPQVGAQPEPLSAFQQWLTMLRYSWNRYVVNYDDQKREDTLKAIQEFVLSLPRRLAEWIRHLGGWLIGLVTGEKGHRINPVLAAIVGGIVVFVLVLVILVVWQRLRRRFGRFKRNHSKRRVGVSSVTFMRDLLRLLERYGHRRLPSQTPREFFTDSRVAELVGTNTSMVLRCYHDARFGAVTLTGEDHERLREVYLRVKVALATRPPSERT